MKTIGIDRRPCVAEHDREGRWDLVGGLLTAEGHRMTAVGDTSFS